MGKKHAPRRGSLQFWPRKRAKRIYARVRNLFQSEKNIPTGFAGYKVGMAHAILADTKKTSISKGMDVSEAVTILECPPLKVASIRAYKKTSVGKTLATEIITKPDKELGRKIKLPKSAAASTSTQKLTDLEKNIDNYIDIRINVYTQPKLTGIGKKKPELFEMGIGGINIKEKLEQAKQLVDKGITVQDIFKEGEQVDIFGVTVGRGFKGPMKRFGIKRTSHKSSKARKNPGNVGPWHGARTWRVPHAGQTGFQQRMERNKLIIKISDSPEEILTKGGFKKYGNVKNTYMILKGSLQGPSKRLLRVEPAQIPNKQTPTSKPELKEVILP